MVQVITEVKRFKKSDSVSVVVQEGITKNGELVLDFRYFVENMGFKGFRKNGIRLEGALVLAFIDFLYNKYVLPTKEE